MKEEAILKINKMGKIAAIVSQIAKVISMIVFIVVTAGTIAMFFMPKQLLSCSISPDVTASIDISGFKNGEFSEENQRRIKNEFAENEHFKNMDFSIDARSFTITGSWDKIHISLSDVISALLWCIVEILLTLINIIFIHRLAKAFEGCTSPFEENVITRMQHLAISLIPWGLLSQSADRAISHMLGQSAPPIAVSLAPICMALIIFMLAYIFKYGARLQQESDETL